MSISTELENLERLRDNGTITEEEFQAAKQRVVAGEAPAASPNAYGTGHAGGEIGPPKIQGIAEDTWCMLMHLSQLLLFAGGLGIVVPIVMWAISKDESDAARRHGARMMNWLISSFIYGIVCAVLCIFLIGIPMIIALLILDVVFPIMAALKANDKILWSYPLTIKFIPED